MQMLRFVIAFSLFCACSETPDTETNTDNIEQDEDEDTPKVDASVKPPARLDASVVVPKPDATTPKPDAAVVVDAGPRDSGAPTLDATAPVDPFAPGDRTPSPDNIPECPKVAPENPVGSCLGVPVYATCSYTTYNCICDWYHWLCL